jgi:hypothetical protein
MSSIADCNSWAILSLDAEEMKFVADVVSLHCDRVEVALATCGEEDAASVWFDDGGMFR